MSWKAAQDEARRWLDLLQLSNEKIRGTIVDLRPHGGLVKAEGQFRTMVFDATKRELKKRGADCILPDLDRRSEWEK